jgi:hypothetical protein
MFSLVGLALILIISILVMVYHFLIKKYEVPVSKGFPEENPRISFSTQQFKKPSLGTGKALTMAELLSD